MSINIYSEDLNTYGIKYNGTDEKNEVWLANPDGTETLLLQFEFPSGAWTPGNSFADQKTGKLYLWDSGSGVTEAEKGFVVYDPVTNTVKTGVKEGYKDGYQKTFQSVLQLDEIIKNERIDLILKNINKCNESFDKCILYNDNGKQSSYNSLY